MVLSTKTVSLLHVDFAGIAWEENLQLNQVSCFLSFFFFTILKNLYQVVSCTCTEGTQSSK